MSLQNDPTSVYGRVIDDIWDKLLKGQQLARWTAFCSHYINYFHHSINFTVETSTVLSGTEVSSPLDAAVTIFYISFSFTVRGHCNLLHCFLSFQVPKQDAGGYYLLFIPRIDMKNISYMRTQLTHSTPMR